MAEVELVLVVVVVPHLGHAASDMFEMLFWGFGDLEIVRYELSILGYETISKMKKKSICFVCP